MNDDDTGDLVPVEPVTLPTPLIAGTFALYDDQNGGYVLVTETTEHGLTRKHIPAAMVKLATGGGLLGRKLAGLVGH
jgi:hypothetical protein